MSGIFETRTLKISNKVFKPDNIRKIFSDIETEMDTLNQETIKAIEKELSGEKFKNLKKEDLEFEKRMRVETRYMNLKIEASDGSEYESESFDILEEGGIIDTKQINSIRFSFVDNNHDVRIYINLKHTDLDYYNDVSIKGGNSIWVNGLMKAIEENINSLQRQPTFAKRYSWLITIVIILCLGYVFGSVLQFILKHIPIELASTNDAQNVKMPKSVAYILFYFLMCASATFPSLYVTAKIKNLWLNVELQTGQEYNQVERQRRINLWLIISLIVIPVLLSILTK